MLLRLAVDARNVRFASPRIFLFTKRGIVCTPKQNVKNDSFQPRRWLLTKSSRSTANPLTSFEGLKQQWLGVGCVKIWPDAGTSFL